MDASNLNFAPPVHMPSSSWQITQQHGFNQQTTTHRQGKHKLTTMHGQDKHKTMHGQECKTIN